MDAEDTQSPLAEHLDLLCCPGCGGDLELDAESFTCASCDHHFGWSDGIPLLFWPNEWSGSREDVTEQVKAFYEETPFPDYDEFDDVGSLIQKARQGLFAKLLDDQIPPGALVLECGCGTGQLSNFLSISNRTLFGTDICVNSLRLGQTFRDENDLRGALFLQMNLFRPCLKPDRFDLVIANGVLHHTSDPLLAFRSIASLVKPGGYILLGLYHRYGRLITDVRRLVFRLLGDRFAFLDPNLRRDGFAAAKRRAWFMDQYKHPHESKHTIGEVLGWLEQSGFRFLKSVPRSKPFQPFSDGESLFEPEESGSRLERLMVELGMIFRGSREGGFFVATARKVAPARESPPAAPLPTAQKSV
jgi:SAM-dependent methyltransferase